MSRKEDDNLLESGINQGDLQAVKNALAAHANPNLRSLGTPLLHLAVKNGNDKIVRLLLKARAKIDMKDTWGQPALACVGKKNGFKIAKLLLEHGAKPTPQVVYQLLNIGKIEEAQLLMAAGVRLDGLLHQAAWGQNLPVARALVNLGARIDEKKHGKTALEVATAQKSIKVAAFLAKATGKTYAVHPEELARTLGKEAAVEVIEGDDWDELVRRKMNPWDLQNQSWDARDHRTVSAAIKLAISGKAQQKRVIARCEDIYYEAFEQEAKRRRKRC